jgi:hypothetical protein
MSLRLLAWAQWVSPQAPALRSVQQASIKAWAPQRSL